MQSDEKMYREQLKENFLKYGLNQFEPNEVLQLLLIYATGNKTDIRQLTDSLIGRFGALLDVFNAQAEELQLIEGMNDSIITLIKLVPELSKLYNIDMMGEGVMMKNSNQFGNYLLPRYIGLTSETVYLVCLDKNYRLICCEKIGDGGFNTVLTSPRKIIHAMVKNHAKYIVLSHNHPTGMAVPSDKDYLATAEVSKMAELVGAELLDHIIVADSDFVSMRSSEGWLNLDK